MKILIVDDSLLIRKEMSSMIESLNHEAILAINGERAIELYKTKKPDIVTMDLSMPVMDGIFALRSIMSIDPQAKVIMATSNGFEQLVLEAIRDGASGYILKPVTIKKLETALQKVIIEIVNQSPKIYSDEDFKEHLFDDV